MDAPDWCEVREWKPDAKFVADSRWRALIEGTGKPWRVIDKVSRIEMLLIPPGTYERGASDSDGNAQPDERPHHQVALTRPIYVGRYEVLASQFDAVVNGHKPTEELGLPAVKVSWNDVAGFLAKCDGLRLPSEAEWEFAARAGASGPTYGPIAEIAVFGANSNGVPAIVGSKRPNALGMYDCLGNVWEWCADWHDGTAYGRCAAGVVDPPEQDNPQRRFKGRVIRGGGCTNPPLQQRLSARPWMVPDYRAGDLGFRVVRDP